MHIFLHILCTANKTVSTRRPQICSKRAEMSRVNAILQKIMYKFAEMTSLIKVENRIRICVRKVRNRQTLWPENPQKRENSCEVWEWMGNTS
jgi:hypothetical protein